MLGWRHPCAPYEIFECSFQGKHEATQYGKSPVCLAKALESNKPLPT